MKDFIWPSQPGHWCCFTEDNVDVQLWINDPPDAIQQIIEKTGAFYELAALRMLRALLPPAPRVVDVGANFGNHSVYFARVCNAAWLMPIEPNQDVIPELRANLTVNGCRADLSRLGIAAGARAGELHLRMDPADAASLNRGGARLMAEEQAIGPTVPVLPLDELVVGEVDLLKIDVEGMAVAVLAGAGDVIARCAPLIFVEVGVSELPAFFDWLSTSSYRVAGALSDYVGLTNLVLQPSASPKRHISPVQGKTQYAGELEARLAQALTEAATAAVHAERADETLRSTLARSAALHRRYAQDIEEVTAQTGSLAQTVQHLNDEIARLRTIESSTLWQAASSFRKLGDHVPGWLRRAVRRWVKGPRTTPDP